MATLGLEPERVPIGYLIAVSPIYYILNAICGIE